LVLATFAGGVSIMVYIILWILIPEAKTTSEKLEMTGNPINISNIEKKVREEFEQVSNKLKNVNYNQVGQDFKNSSSHIGKRITDVLEGLFQVFSKILGSFILMLAGGVLMGISIGSLLLICFGELPESYIGSFQSSMGIETPLYLQGILLFFSVGIPFFFLFLLGLKLVASQRSSINVTLKYSLIAIWFIAITTAITLTIKETKQVAFDAKTMKKEVLTSNASDTLNLKFQYNPFFSKDLSESENIVIKQDSLGKTILYSNDVKLYLKKSENNQAYFIVEKESSGKSFSDAKNKALNIKYQCNIKNNVLQFDNYFTTDAQNKIRNQKIEIYLYLPEGQHLFLEKGFTKYIRHYKSDFENDNWDTDEISDKGCLLSVKNSEIVHKS